MTFHDRLYRKKLSRPLLQAIGQKKRIKWKRYVHYFLYNSVMEGSSNFIEWAPSQQQQEQKGKKLKQKRIRDQKHVYVP